MNVVMERHMPGEEIDGVNYNKMSWVLLLLFYFFISYYLSKLHKWTQIVYSVYSLSAMVD